MTITHEVLKELWPGYSIACELPCAEAGMRVFVEALCRTIPGATPFAPLERASGFEIRYVKHHAKYTIGDFGNDYHLALNDETTIVKSSFIDAEESLADALAPWDIPADAWQHSLHWDSTLLGLTAPIGRRRENSGK
jgi:hypothetical protein